MLMEDRRQKEQGMTENEIVGITNSVDMSLSKLQEMVNNRNPGTLQSIGFQRIRHY